MRYCFGVAALAALCGVSWGGVIWDEGVDGGLSNDPDLPTPVSLSLGSNVVRGTTGPGSSAPSEAYDVFTFTVGAGEVLESVFLDSYASGTGNTSGFGLYAGPDATGGFASGDFGGSATMFSGSVGTDLLAVLSGGVIDLSGPRGPGQYTVEIREFGEAATWELDFVVTPSPGGAGLLGVGAWVLGCRRRRG